MTARNRRVQNRQVFWPSLPLRAKLQQFAQIALGLAASDRRKIADSRSIQVSVADTHARVKGHPNEPGGSGNDSGSLARIR